MKCIGIGLEERRKVESGVGVGVGWKKRRGDKWVLCEESGSTEGIPIFTLGQ